jgi:hypothetical protein
MFLVSMWLRKRSANAGLAAHTRAQFARSNDEPSDQQERDQARIRPPAADDLVAIDGNEFVEHERQGFTVSQVVHDYGDVCQAITELAVELNAPITVQSESLRAVDSTARRGGNRPRRSGVPGSAGGCASSRATRLR